MRCEIQAELQKAWVTMLAHAGVHLTPRLELDKRWQTSADKSVNPGQKRQVFAEKMSRQLTEDVV